MSQEFLKMVNYGGGIFIIFMIISKTTMRDRTKSKK